MIYKYWSILCIALVFFACHHLDTAKSAHPGSAASDMGVNPVLKSLHFDYNKDPACGMPLHAGLEDTTVYKGKLYGFCSKECKAAFWQNPASFVAQIK